MAKDSGAAELKDLPQSTQEAMRDEVFSVENSSIQNLYSDLNILSLRNDWQALEQHFYQLAEQYAGPELANPIQSIDLTEYTIRLSSFLVTECMRASHHAVKALYWEYDLDNQWNSHLFFCGTYTRLALNSDSWARQWIDCITGPDLTDFAALYRQQGGFHVENDAEVAVTFYLIARTVAAFGRAVQAAPTHKMSICTGHHGQARITRVYEYR
jgi:hypothetical protein